MRVASCDLASLFGRRVQLSAPYACPQKPESSTVHRQAFHPSSERNSMRAGAHKELERGRRTAYS
jgi:hypothetical protein